MNFNQNMEFTLGEETEKSNKKELSSNELSKQLERLIQDQADNQRVFDWVEVCIGEGEGTEVMGQDGRQAGNKLFSCCRGTWTSSRRPPTCLSEL